MVTSVEKCPTLENMERLSSEILQQDVVQHLAFDNIDCKECRSVQKKILNRNFSKPREKIFERLGFLLTDEKFSDIAPIVLALILKRCPDRVGKIQSEAINDLYNPDLITPGQILHFATLAVEADNLAFLKYLSGVIHANERADFEKCIASEAATSGKTDIFSWLLDDLKFPDGQDYVTCFVNHYCITNNSSKILDWLESRKFEIKINEYMIEATVRSENTDFIKCL